MTGRFVASFFEEGVCHVSERISPCGTLHSEILSMLSALYLTIFDHC